MAPLRAFVAEFDPHLQELIADLDGLPDRLREAMAYALLAPGKRMRPFIVTQSCILAGGTPNAALAPAAAIECVHAFSLVHDDLPAMDDDDLRRGRPTTHKQFDEATAILAGDALLTLAFETITTRCPDGPNAARMVAVLARATGAAGMIGGQMADIIHQDQPVSLDTTRYIHERKTAQLFEAAASLGAIAANAEDSTIAALADYGRNLGLAFQIADDLLDLTATSEQLGKKSGKDAARGKQTFPQCVGKEESLQAATAATQEAIAALAPFGDRAADLVSLAKYAVSRNY